MDGEQPWQNRYTFWAFAISLALAVIVTYAIEKPAAKLLDRWRTKRVGKSPAGGDPSTTADTSAQDDIGEEQVTS